MNTSNLPSWPGAKAVYSRAYRLLTLMSKTHVSVVRGQLVPSETMNELIDALNRGDEASIKRLIMSLGQYYPEIYS